MAKLSKNEKMQGFFAKAEASLAKMDKNKSNDLLSKVCSHVCAALS